MGTGATPAVDQGSVEGHRQRRGFPKRYLGKWLQVDLERSFASSRSKAAYGREGTSALRYLIAFLPHYCRSTSLVATMACMIGTRSRRLRAGQARETTLERVGKRQLAGGLSEVRAD